MKRSPLWLTTALALVLAVPAFAQSDTQTLETQTEQPVQSERPAPTEEAAPVAEQPKPKKRKKEAAEIEAPKAEQAEQPREEPKPAEQVREETPKQEEAAARAEQPSAEPKVEEKAEEPAPKPKKKRAERPAAEPKIEEKAEQPAAEPKAEETVEQPAQAPAAAETQSEQPAATTETAEPKPRKKRKREAEVEQPAQPDADQAERPTQLPETPATGQAVTEQPSRQPADQAERPTQLPETPATGQVVGQEPATPAQQTTIVDDNETEAAKAARLGAEKKRRAEKRKRRNELLGAAAAGAVVGVIVNELGGRVVGDEGDRLVIERDGQLIVRKDENERLRARGDEVFTEQLRGGRTRTIVERPNGARIITVRDSGGFILRRVKEFPNGDRVVMIDNEEIEPTQTIDYDRRLGDVRLGIPLEDYIVETRRADRRALRRTFEAAPVEDVERAYTLREVRESERLRAKMRRVDLDTVTFDSGSAAITRSQVDDLAPIADAMLAAIENDPAEVFIVEGHTDAVGNDISNLTLSDRRAETIARVLSEVYDVPPENLIVQGYGEQYLKVRTEAAERANRRVSIRRITPLLRAG